LPKKEDVELTTIACDLKEMAADSCVTYDDIGVGTGQYASKKLHRIGKSLFGERGESTAEVPLVLEWIRGGCKQKRRPTLTKNADFFLLELSPKGIFLWTHHLARDPVYEPNFAIGSGTKAALYCMRVLKMSPRRAVEEAAKVDIYTKAPFVVERLPA
jgi:ATP-dependent protease HslVU (ClpYQ) peptidase subunit